MSAPLNEQQLARLQELLDGMPCESLYGMILLLTDRIVDEKKGTMMAETLLRKKDITPKQKMVAENFLNLLKVNAEISAADEK